jgi:selenoprotein W-related protein
LAAKLLAEYKQKIATLELVPSGGGCFEIDVDGKRIYSKLETESFPDEDEIVKQLGK